MNWLAAPFNGLLAEKVEQLLTGKPMNTGSGMDVVKDLPRILGREWIKLKYYLPRALVFCCCFSAHGGANLSSYPVVFIQRLDDGDSIL